MSGYVFYCSRCKVDHAGECPPATNSCEGYVIEAMRWPDRIAEGMRFEWADGIHVIGKVAPDGKTCDLLCYGKTNQVIGHWQIIDGQRPAGAIRWVH